MRGEERREERKAEVTDMVQDWQDERSQYYVDVLGKLWKSIEKTQLVIEKIDSHLDRMVQRLTE